MIIQMKEVNRENIHDWGIPTLMKFKESLTDNIHRKLGDIPEEKLMIELINVEISRQTKIQNVNLAAEVKKEKLIVKAGINDGQL